MRKLYKFYADCGRMGDLDAVFTADPDDVKKLIGFEVYFGEILGKHSDIFFHILEDMIVEVECSDTFVTEAENILGCRGYNGSFPETPTGKIYVTLSGDNPFSYIEPGDFTEHECEHWGIPFE